MSISAPAMNLGAFQCPHCHAHTQQTWWDLYAEPRLRDEPPGYPDRKTVEDVISGSAADDRPEMEKYVAALFATDPQPYREKSTGYINYQVPNLFLSRCFVCKRSAVWLRGQLIFPVNSAPVEPNEDLPEEVRADFLEAAAIASASPRGAAALLRLSIEKLCLHLGKTGGIDKMIGDLVADGLHMKVQQALDVVRVIGNESVHPGSIDVKDDPATVQSLFRLVNIIAETMITDHRKVAEMFNGLPPEKLAGIEQRNARALARSEGKNPAGAEPKST